MATLMGAVQRGMDKTAVTYFYLGSGGVSAETIRQICTRAGKNAENVEPKDVLCTALELPEETADKYKIIGFAYLNENRRITVLSSDEYYKEYIGEFAREAVVYYDYGKQ